MILRKNKMKKTVLFLVPILVFFMPVLTFGQNDYPEAKYFKGSMFFTVQIGFSSFAATVQPFDTLPFPVGASFEFFIADRIALGGTVMYEKWSDNLGLFSGKYTFHLFKPSFDVTYHLGMRRLRSLDLFVGANLGYSLLYVSNELDNDYPGNLKNEPHIAPFLGTNFNFWENGSGFLNNIQFNLKVGWSLTGKFFGLFSTIGITFRVR